MRILQILPAEGWWAEWMDDSGETPQAGAERLVCFALVDEEIDPTLAGIEGSTSRVVGLRRDGGELVSAEDETFVRYVHREEIAEAEAERRAAREASVAREARVLATLLLALKEFTPLPHNVRVREDAVEAMTSRVRTVLAAGHAPIELSRWTDGIGLEIDQRLRG